MGGLTSPRLMPILSRPDELTNIKEAAHHVNRSPKTIRKWCRTLGIGRQSVGGAAVEVNRVALEMVVHGDMDALEAFRRGEREAEIVSRYFVFLGFDPAA